MVASLKILHYKSLESTSTTAYRLAEQSAPDWTVVIADVQTRGRGRGRNKWKSPKGGLWFSIILRPKLPGPRLPLLQFLVAIAMRTALEDATGLRVKLKWPNDLVIGKEKLGGILIESKTLGAQVSFAILGVGLNVNQGRAQLPFGATSLQVASGKQHNIRLLLRAVLRQIRSSFDLLDQPSKLIDDWWRNCVHRPMRVRITVSDDVLTGISRGVDENGALLIETDDHRIRRVSEGSLSILDD